LVGVAVLVGTLFAGGLLGFWAAASNGIHGVDDIVGAPLLGIVLVGFAVFVGWSFVDPGIPIPRRAGWSAVVSGVAAGLFALFAGWSAVAVVFAVLSSALVVGCLIWSIGDVVAETRRRKAGELPAVDAPVAVAGTQIASNRQRAAARFVDFLLVGFAACSAEALWPGPDQNGFFITTTWWAVGALVTYEVASVACGGSVAKRLYRLRVVSLSADDPRWPRVGIIRAMVRTLLLPLAVLNVIVIGLGVNVVHRLDPRLDLLEGTGAGTVVMPKKEVSHLRALGPTERKAVLGELDHELRQPPISVSRKELVIALVVVAVVVALRLAADDGETNPPLPIVPTFPLPTLPFPTSDRASEPDTSRVDDLQDVALGAGEQAS
jgi:hypothetical protein